MTAVSANDCLCTPEYILARVRELGRIALDPCGNPNSLVRPTYALSLENGDDGLSADWLHYVEMAGSFGPLVYCNPPFGRGHLRQWTAKVAHEASRGCEIVTMTPHDITTAWWQTMLTTAQARVDVDHRIAFVGGEHGGGIIRNAIWYHGDRRYLFAHHFESLGEMHVYAPRRKT